MDITNFAKYVNITCNINDKRDNIIITTFNTEEY